MAQGLPYTFSVAKQNEEQFRRLLLAILADINARLTALGG